MTKKKNPKDLQKVGQKPFFDTNEQLQKQIMDYIDNCPDAKELFTKDGTAYVVPNYTITGLAYHLGFASRQSFYDYEEKPEFTYTIKRARLFIEKEYEIALRSGNPCMIFALKNFGWKDKTEVENINTNLNIESNIDKAKELKKLLDKE